MKTKPREVRKAHAAPARAPVVTREVSWQPYALTVAAALLVFWAYAPAAHGPFLFDDTVLPFALPGFDAPLRSWIQGVRPFLMATYWLNARLSGEDPFFYHVFNVILHCITSGLVFVIVRRLVQWSGRQPAWCNLLAGLAAAVFLLHPVQAETVAYLAGRSEALSVMLLMAAYTVFLYRPAAVISWGTVATLVTLFLAALLSKEHTIVLPALLLLTDYWWNPGFSLEGIRRNWRLYAFLALGAVWGVAQFWQLLISSPSAGFGLKDLTWYQYFFTQCRALFVYIGLFLFPANLTADWDFPISKTILDHGALVGLLALLALASLAWRYRRQYRLASFGFFAYLLLMAPTSSILPIRDPVAERRLYLSMLGLLLIIVDLLGRVKLERKPLAVAGIAVALILAAATHARAGVWSSAVALWEDTAQKSPNKARVHFQLGSAYCGAACGGVEEGPPHCDLAVREYQKAAQLQKPNYDLLVDWAAAYDCSNQPENALSKLRDAASLETTAHVYTQIAKVYGEQRRWADALDALATAEKLEPNYAVTYAYRGLVHLGSNQAAPAVQDFQRALALDPKFQQAKDGLAQAQARLRASQ